MLRDLTRFPCLTICFPGRVTGTEWRLYFHMAAYRHLHHLTECGALTIRKEPRSVLDREKVLLDDPRARLVPMASSEPIPDSLVNGLIFALKSPIFPSRNLSVDPRSGRKQRHHLSPSALQHAVRNAIRAVDISKHALCHTFRHSFATHLLESGQFQWQEVQALLGHKNIQITQRYLHVMKKKANPLNW